MKRAYAFPTGLSLAAAIMVAGLLTGCRRTPLAHAAPPPSVEVAAVTQRDVPVRANWIATLQGYVTAQIQPQVTGYIIRQTYREGSYLRRGDQLFQIDPRPFQAVLDQARAQLAEARAKLGDAALNVQRDIPEAQAHAIPQSQLDDDMQTKLEAQAEVAAAQASVEQARLNLGYTDVRSLISGIAGIAQVQVGNLVSPSTVLTGISQVNPIKAYFPISGNEYLRIASRIPPGAAGRTADPIRLQLTLSDGQVYPYPGRVLFADRQLDPQTGTIQIVGAFPNPRRLLRPGQTGRITAVIGIDKNALLVPARAVTELQAGYEVAVVGAGNKIHIQSVDTGQQVGSLWEITSGLRAGERVVAEGMDKVRDGMIITPEPYAPGGGSGTAAPAAASGGGAGA